MTHPSYNAVQNATLEAGSIAFDPKKDQPAGYGIFLNVFYLAEHRKHADNLPCIEILEGDMEHNDYYGPLTRRNLRLKVGTLVRAVSPGKNNRRMLILAGHTGNLVLFERYTGGDKGVLVMNVPREYTHLFGGSASTEHDVQLMTGGLWGTNVVQIMTDVMRTFITTDFSGDQIVTNNDRDLDDE
jgi:hypothetical protein